MQRKLSLLLLPVAGFFVFFYGFANSIKPAERAVLESAYGEFIAALDKQDHDAFRESVSSRMYADVHNSYASMGKKIGPDHFKSMTEFLPKLEKFEFLELRQIGPTAGLLYSQVLAGDGDDKDFMEFVFLKFVNEGNGWRFHGADSHAEEKVASDGTLASYDFTKLDERMAINGKLAPAPALREPVEVAGYCQVLTYGYETEVTINGGQSEKFSGGSIFQIIPQGLLRGENTVEVRFKPIEENPMIGPKVAIRVRGDEGQVRELIEIAPEAEEIENVHRHKFTVAGA
jgi:hypothetical protein